MPLVFIHRSIKTRIETYRRRFQCASYDWFLYIDPLKQGLKLLSGRLRPIRKQKVFIHRSIKTRIETSRTILPSISGALFLYIDPLKQGLKQIGCYYHIISVAVFIHRSIKTRIETSYLRAFSREARSFYTQIQ